ncbi:hypothetical protein [Pseudarthrobacter sp. TAF60_1]|uniref:hypothetical protein n=1 Tax=Pseudarthrobacter sp. TAF60_1 TaxID=3233071 RepID=UPI003F9CF3FD
MTSSQNGNERYVVRPWWRARSLPWAALVVGAIIVTAIALERTTLFFYATTPEFIERLRVGRLVMLAGAAMSLAAAIWSQVRGHPLWVTVCVASPAVLVGMAIMIMTVPSPAPQIAALIALPAAIAGLIGGLFAHPRG